MGNALFPRRREDGSCCVSARFAITAPQALAAAHSAVASWLATRSTWSREAISNESLVAEDLRVAPHIVALGDDQIDVVFEGRPGRPYWKDWMVAITIHLSAIPGIAFECFYDHVAGAPHPASVRFATSTP